MKVLELCSLGSLHSSEIEPAGSIGSSSDVQSQENGYRRRERQPGTPCHVNSDDDYYMERC